LNTKNLRNLHLKIKYDSDSDDVLEEFYVPVLENSIFYKRIAGFFSSTSLSIAARGIFGLIKNGGKMQLLTSSYFSDDDLDIIKNHVKTKEQVLFENFRRDLSELDDALKKDHLKALAWLLSRGLLEIKIVDVLDDHNQILSNQKQKHLGMMHMKIGIFTDGTNTVSFSGSINESATGWYHSIEEIKIFRDWEDGQKNYVYEDLKEFEKYWKNSGKRSITYDLPTAIKNELLKIAPKKLEDLNLSQTIQIPIQQPEEKIQLRPHQINAIDSWKNNDYRGILAMATGSGKTLCALHAADLAPKSTLTIICVPTIPLANQWESEIRNFDKDAAIIRAGTSQSNWSELLGPKLAPYRLSSDVSKIEKRTFIICTNHTASDPSFVNMWTDILPDHIQLIADEVHHLGADSFQNVFKINAMRRLGLSATPERQWDDEGNQTVLNYFKKTVYEYDIKRAIADGYLAHYTYHPLFASMNDREFQEFHALTVEIGREVAIHNQKEKQFGTWLPISDYHKQLLEKRALVKKKTGDKINVFRDWCRQVNQNQILVFCEDTEQMNELINVLNNAGKKYVIYKSDMSDSQKSSSLRLFKENQIDLMLAIRCLDEGLDVPDCAACIIVSSSTSIREFVQRRGRVLRMTNPSKIANVYDMLVMPPADFLPEQEKAVQSMIDSEVERVKIMIDSADNESDVFDILRQKLQYYDM